jgi:hypothetical protein
MIKSLAKNLPHPLLLRLHHRYDLRRQSALAHTVSQLTGLPLLETLDLSRVKTSDTAFVLGGGWSINEISEHRWQTIGRHDTIALNFWPVHPFVPRIYLFENLCLTEGYELMFNALQGLLGERADTYRNVTKIITEVQPLAPRQLVFEIPERFRRDLYIGYSTGVVARSEQELQAGLRYLGRRGVFAPRNRITWQFKYGSSVIAAMSLAACMNYRRIVLCGIDLGKADYFYHHPERYPKACKWEFRPRTQAQITTLKLEWRLPAQNAIHLFKREVLDPAHIELFVENRSSELFPQVPEVPQQLFEELPKAHPGAR